MEPRTIVVIEIVNYKVLNNGYNDELIEEDELENSFIYFSFRMFSFYISYILMDSLAIDAW